MRGSFSSFSAGSGAWETAPVGGAVEQSDYLNAAAALQAYLTAGVPPAKLQMGVPFYGRGWRGVANVNNGLHQAHRGVSNGTWENGIFDYSDLVDNYLPTYTRHWHEEAKVPWLYNADTGIMISYDDPESLALKVDYVREQRLGGVMLWDLSSDDDEGTLLGVLYEGLRQPPVGRFIRGDCNVDAIIDLTDAVYLLNYNFTGGPAPACVAACDADGDGAVNGQVTDALYVLNFSFLGGVAPPARLCGDGQGLQELTSEKPTGGVHEKNNHRGTCRRGHPLLLELRLPRTAGLA